MGRKEFKGVSWFLGVAALAVSCGDTPGAGTPGEELEVGPTGVVQLALDSDGGIALMGWPFDDLTLKVSKFKAGAASEVGAVVKTDPKTKVEIRGLCATISAIKPSVVIAEPVLSPWFYRVEAEVTATVGGRPVRLNNADFKDFVVMSGAATTAPVRITQAAAMAFGLDVAVATWNP